MRAGVAPRDYKAENADWAALVAAVDRWTTADEEASIAYALGRTSASSSSTAGPTAAEKEARRGATEAVARAKRAYALLYQALSDELRRLVAHVPQGDAYGLWSWLEKRFQSTEQDNVGDLWDQFTTLYQADDESFDQYKARVDHVLRSARARQGQAVRGPVCSPSAVEAVCPLQPGRAGAEGQRQAEGGRKIDWDEIVAFVNNHERSEQRLNGDDDARRTCDGGDDAGRTARRPRTARRRRASASTAARRGTSPATARRRAGRDSTRTGDDDGADGRDDDGRRRQRRQVRRQVRRQGRQRQGRHEVRQHAGHRHARLGNEFLGRCTAVRLRGGVRPTPTSNPTRSTT